MSTETLNPAEEIICDCTGTTRSKVQTLFEQGLDFAAISRKTGVNTGCGGCEWEIESFIEELHENNKTR